LGRAGSITVGEDVKQDPDLGTVARIRVSDDGPGIPAAIIGRVMEPFFTTKAEGTGLGLSIAARIIDEHGGRIDVTSVEFEETAFTIKLPVIGGAS
jgi:signal transduction histidine kinase